MVSMSWNCNKLLHCILNNHNPQLICAATCDNLWISAICKDRLWGWAVEIPAEPALLLTKSPSPFGGHPFPKTSIRPWSVYLHALLGRLYADMRHLKIFEHIFFGYKLEKNQWVKKHELRPVMAESPQPVCLTALLGPFKYGYDYDLQIYYSFVTECNISKLESLKIMWKNVERTNGKWKRWPMCALCLGRIFGCDGHACRDWVLYG